MSLIRREDGSLRKENPEVTANLDAEIIRYKTAIRRAERMAALKDLPGWLDIQDILKEKVEGIDKRLDEFGKNEHRQNDLLMQERKNYNMFISIVDDFAGSIAGFEERIERCEKELARRKVTAPSL